MAEPRTKLSKRMSKALALIEMSLASLTSQPSSAPLASEAENRIWEAYRNVEYAIALLKLEYGAEVGTDVKEKRDAKAFQPSFADISTALTAATELAASGNLLEAIVRARNVRNALAEMLYAFRKARAKK